MFAGCEFVAGCAFVLVAGGLGERLGFSGIKVALPWQITSGQTYIELYIRSILALQQEAYGTMLFELFPRFWDAVKEQDKQTGMASRSALEAAL